MKNFTKDDLLKYIAILPTDRDECYGSPRTQAELFVEGFEDWLKKNAQKTNPSAIANKFLQDNLQAIAKERRSKTPELMPRNALYLQATRLFAAVPPGIYALNVVEKELNRLCLERVAEGT